MLLSGSWVVYLQLFGPVVLISFEGIVIIFYSCIIFLVGTIITPLNVDRFLNEGREPFNWDEADINDLLHAPVFAFCEAK
jgi:hypothetical protein